MRDDDAAFGDFRRALLDNPLSDLLGNFGKLRGDVFVRNAMEAVAAHAIAEKFLRKRHELRHRRHRAMKRSVKAGHLWNVWPLLRGDFDGRQVGGKMQRREGNELAKLSQSLRSDTDGLREIRAAMDHTMADRCEFFTGKVGFEPGLKNGESPCGILNFGCVEILVVKNLVGCVLYFCVWRCANAVD